MPNCVCCGIETNGTYNKRFPVCFECYETEKIKTVLLKLDITKRKFYLEFPDIIDNWFELIKARDELKENL